MGWCACFDGGNTKQRRREEDMLSSVEARTKAAEAAQKRPDDSRDCSPVRSNPRQEEFDKSAVGRAARAQIQAMQKQSETANKGEPVLKWQMG